MTQGTRISGLLTLTILPLILFVSLAGARASAQEEGARTAPRGQQALYGEFRIKPFQVVGNVYFVGLSNNTAYLVTTPAGHFLINPTLKDALPDIRKSIEELGFNVRDIKFLLQTHAHGGHIAGLPAMRELTGAKAPVMSQEIGVFEDGGKSDYRGNGGETFTPMRADRVIQDGDKIELGGVTMVAHLTAGHTKGSTTWTTVAEENGKRYNVVIASSVRMNPRQPLLGNSKYSTLAEDFPRSFAKLKSLPCDVILVDHSTMFEMREKMKQREQNPGTNPFIDPAACGRFVAKYERSFVDQLAKERAGGPAFAPAPDDPTQPDSSLPCPEDGRTCYGARPARRR